MMLQVVETTGAVLPALGWKKLGRQCVVHRDSPEPMQVIYRTKAWPKRAEKRVWIDNAMSCSVI
jgi:hypothetical protein